MNKRLWIAVLGLFIVNLLIAYLAPVDVIRPDGTHVVLSRWTAVQNLSIMLAFWMSFAAAGIAVLGALVPYGGLEYGKRYPRAFVLSLTAAYVFWVIIGVNRILGAT